jgi:hypothetical protein
MCRLSSPVFALVKQKHGSARSIPDETCAGTFLPRNTQQKTGYAGFLLRVAGPGIEPGSGGYEPPEVPLLYPAMYLFCCTLLVLTGPVQVV